jgi:hypothetical protein
MITVLQSTMTEQSLNEQSLELSNEPTLILPSPTLSMQSKKRKISVEQVNSKKRRIPCIVISDKAKRKVRFDLHQNITIQTRPLTKEETSAAWISDEEHHLIRRNIAKAVKYHRLQQQSVMSLKEAENKTSPSMRPICMRGIEQFISPGKTEERMKDLSKHRLVIIFLSQIYRHHYQEGQNRLPEAFKQSIRVLFPSIDIENFHSKEELLSHYTSRISVPYSTHAAALGKLDAMEAKKLYTE